MADTKQRATGYPAVSKVLHEIADQAPKDATDVHHITVRVLENGEVAYRLHQRGAEEPIGGVFKVRR